MTDPTPKMASTGQKDNANVLTGDSGPGTGIRDLLPIPEANPVDLTQAGDNETSFSHALANDDHAEKGHVQLGGSDDEIQDLGWNEKKEDIPAPLVGGMDNEELWLLLRRFDKVSHDRLVSRRFKMTYTTTANLPSQSNFVPGSRRPRPPDRRRGTVLA